MQRTQLTEVRDVAEGTKEFTFARPDGFDYKAGQTIDLVLIDPPETDDEGNSRALSLVSAPHEPALRIATRMRDTAFKRVLGALGLGAEVGIDGPFDTSLFHADADRPAVFLAGGIGVTPFRSLIADAAHRALPHPIALFYANRRPEDAAFLGELAEFAKTHPQLTFIPTMTADGAIWEGERGRIDAAMLERTLANDAHPIYYLAGPQAMVTAMRAMLNALGVPDTDIRFEEFSGY